MILVDSSQFGHVTPTRDRLQYMYVAVMAAVKRNETWLNKTRAKAKRLLTLRKE